MIYYNINELNILNQRGYKMANAFLKGNLFVNNCPVSIIGNNDNVMVARLADSELWFYGMYSTRKRAEDVAKELGNAVVFEVDNITNK